MQGKCYLENIVLVHVTEYNRVCHTWKVVPLLYYSACKSEYNSEISNVYTKDMLNAIVLAIY